MTALTAAMTRVCPAVYFAVHLLVHLHVPIWLTLCSSLQVPLVNWGW